MKRIIAATAFFLAVASSPAPSPVTSASKGPFEGGGVIVAKAGPLEGGGVLVAKAGPLEGGGVLA